MPKKQTTIKTFEDVDAKLRELGKHKIELKKKETEMNEEVESITAKYDALTKFRREQVISIEADIEAFCREHDSEFKKVRAMKLTFGRVGFRTLTESVVLLNKRYKWDGVLIAIKEQFKRRFIRMVESLDKELILRKYREGKLTDAELAEAGLKIDQGEEFVLKLNWKSINEKQDK